MALADAVGLAPRSDVLALVTEVLAYRTEKLDIAVQDKKIDVSVDLQNEM
jgi:hypothetical protein